MIYMTSDDGQKHIIILEPGNIQELRKGRPAETPDKQVLIFWTPDPVWLADKILESEGDIGAIAAAIKESLERPERLDKRPHHETYEKKFFKGGPA